MVGPPGSSLDGHSSSSIQAAGTSRAGDYAPRAGADKYWPEARLGARSSRPCAELRPLITAVLLSGTPEGAPVSMRTSWPLRP